MIFAVEVMGKFAAVFAVRQRNAGRRRHSNVETVAAMMTHIAQARIVVSVSQDAMITTIDVDPTIVVAAVQFAWAVTDAGRNDKVSVIMGRESQSTVAPFASLSNAGLFAANNVVHFVSNHAGHLESNVDLFGRVALMSDHVDSRSVRKTITVLRRPMKAAMHMDHPEVRITMDDGRAMMAAITVAVVEVMAMAMITTTVLVSRAVSRTILVKVDTKILSCRCNSKCL